MSNVPGPFDCPRCGKHHKNNRDISNHVFRRNPCDPVLNNIPVEVLRQQPQYRDPYGLTCEHCGRSGLCRSDLYDHVQNKRCPVLKQPNQAPAATLHAIAVRRSYMDPDSSFVSALDWDFLAKAAVEVCPGYVLVALFKCLCERPDQPQNHQLVVMKNVRDRHTMACWQPTSDSAGSYAEVCNSLVALRRLLRQPSDKLRHHMEQQGLHVPQELVCQTDSEGTHATTAATDEALSMLVAYMEGATRLARGLSLLGSNVRQAVRFIHDEPALSGDWSAVLEHLLQA